MEGIRIVRNTLIVFTVILILIGIVLLSKVDYDSVRRFMEDLPSSFSYFFEEKDIITLLIGIIVVVIPFVLWFFFIKWYYFGYHYDSCDWCKELRKIRNVDYYSCGRHRISGNVPLFCSRKCENAWEASKDIKETRQRIIFDDV